MAAPLQDKRGPEKRGPRIGDAASLWNFTPAPGWTKEEAQILKLCLMKHGVGRWIQILDTGLLPGKLIQQLNGQTQRLLGQQSLAAYTGLHVDIDRIRADNDKLVEAERKNGLVIHDGPNLTKQQKQQMQEDAKAKYGLSDLELQEVEEQLQELLAGRAGGAGGQAALPEAKAAAAGAVRGRAQREAELLARDTASMSKEQKVNFLLHLHEKLQQAAARLTTAVATAAARPANAEQPPAAAAAAVVTAAPTAPPHVASAAAAAAAMVPAGSAENKGVVANAAPMQLDAPAAAIQLHQQAKPAAAAGRAQGGKRKASGGRRAQVQQEWSSEEDDDWQPAARAPSSRGRRGTAAAEAMDVDGDEQAQPRAGGGRAAAAAAAAAADVEQLVAMGFTAKQARDALEESGQDVEAAIEWLVTHCV